METKDNKEILEMINQLDKQDFELSSDIKLLFDEIKNIEEKNDILPVKEEISNLKETIRSIELQKGDKGDKGDNGKDGKNGEDGKDGLNGRDGIDGVDGTDGTDGKDGSPDTPEQVVEKLNTLENVLELKVIKDFPKIEDNAEIKRQVDTIGNQVLRLLSRKSEIPNVDLSGYVPNTRTISINGTTQDLSADRTWTTPTIGSVGITIDGQGGVITTGFNGSITVPFSGTITGWRILETSSTPISSSIEIDIWKDNYSNYPATIADAIFVTKPTLSSAIKNENLSPTFIGSGATISAGDVISFSVNSSVSAVRVNLILFINKLS